MNWIFDTEAMFPHGLLVCTANASRTIAANEITAALTRHLHGDWGDVGKEDWAENDWSLKNGFRLFSVYHTSSGVKFWIITEADRSATTVLLPTDY